MQTHFSLTLLSYLLLSAAITYGNAIYSSQAFLLCTLGLLCLLIALPFSRKKGEAAKSSESRNPGLLFAVYFSSSLFFIAKPALQYVTTPQYSFFLCFIVAALFLMTGLIFLRNQKRGFYLCFAGLLLVWTAASIWVIRAVPAPPIDVWYTQQEGAAYFLKGQNPYDQNISMPIEEKLQPFPLTKHFVYLPYTLLVTVPSYYFLGDIRYTNLLFGLTAGIFLFGVCKNTGKSRLEAASLSFLFLFHPRFPYLAEFAWTEPTFIALLFAALYFLQRNQSKIFAVFSGLFLSAKQHLVLFIFYFLSFLKGKWMELSLLLGTFLALPLLFFALSPHHFLENTLWHHLDYPFREDSLSLSVFFFKHFGTPLPRWLPFVFGLGASLLASRQENPHQKTLWMALAYYLFFWLNPLAFCNYYFFVESLLIVSLALSPKPDDSRPTLQTL